MKDERTIPIQGIRVTVHYGTSYRNTVAVWRDHTGIIHQEHGPDALKRARRAIAGGAR